MSGLASVAILSGCATVPTTEIAAPELAPEPALETESMVSPGPTSVTEALRAAQEAFEAANAAQEKGDTAGALDQYMHMLEMMKTANLDPSLFYNLRSEFERILTQGESQAQLAERRKEWEKNGGRGFVVGDIPVPFPVPEEVLQEIEEIQTLYPRNFQAGLDRSFKYLPYIRAELAQAGLPQDLAWLAMVESQFHPKVQSRAGARGMWQFMSATATRHNLAVGTYVDERYDWRKATRAAAVYLNSLGERFNGDWSLALTAYNMGEYGLERAIASAGNETDLFKLIRTSTRMQQETKKFWPKFMATVMVAQDPERFGFTLNPQPEEELASVRVKGSYSLATLEKASGLPQGSLTLLNAHLVRGVTPPGGEYEINVPAESAGQVMAALSQVPEVKYEPPKTTSGGSTYKVKRGDTLSGIASKYRVSVKDLMKANKIRSASHLRTGSRLTIPGGAEVVEESDEPAPAEAAPSKTASKTVTQGQIYTVKKGDTLFDIATANNVTLKDLMSWNRKTSTRISVGEKLIVAPGSGSDGGAVAVSESVPASEEPERTVHVVKAGEFPGKIASAYGVSLSDLLKWNNLTSKSTLKVGDKLTILGGESGGTTATAKVEPAKASEPVKTTHTVAKGETTGTIAQKHGVKLADLLQWNNLTSKSVIRVGDKLTIQGGSNTVAAAEEKKAPEPVVHVVAKGENATTIARRYDVQVSELLLWNNLDAKTVLQVGQKVKISKS